MLSTNSTISTNTSRIMPSNNSSLPISSQVTTTTTTTILMTTSYLFENANIINMFGGVFLTLIGCMGNILALLILVYSRNRQPRISGVNYLILLTITNTVFLALHFYMSTYNRIVYFFGLDYQSSLLFLDSSTLLCKTLSYMKYSARSLNTMLTVCFCLERLLAVYYPLQMRALDGKCSIIFRVGIIVSFILPSYSLFLTELVANTDTVRVRSSFNLTASFNFYSLTPSFGQFTCSANSENFKVNLIYNYISLTFMFVFLFLFFFAKILI